MDAGYSPDAKGIPADQAGNVSTTAGLGWVAAEGATSYDVYLDTVDPPQLFQDNQTQTTFDPAGHLNVRTTYYWRVDSVGASGTTGGDIWSFTTGSYPGDFDGDGDVDQTDFGGMQACFSGSGQSYESGCTDADFDGDGDVDQGDFETLRACMAGADNPPGC